MEADAPSHEGLGLDREQTPSLGLPSVATFTSTLKVSINNQPVLVGLLVTYVYNQRCGFFSLNLKYSWKGLGFLELEACRLLATCSRALVFSRQLKPSGILSHASRKGRVKDHQQHPSCVSFRKSCWSCWSNA